MSIESNGAPGTIGRPAPPSRSLIAADIAERTGLDEVMLARVVHAFYGRARRDPLIGPIFEGKVQDWDAHLERMCAFWSSVALMTGRYHGQPMPAHLPLPVAPEHFDRWLGLFADTLRETCPPPAAAHLSERAVRIAESLELGIAAAQGGLPPKRRPRREPNP
jgi:hemoglobin